MGTQLGDLKAHITQQYEQYSKQFKVTIINTQLQSELIDIHSI
jgi:hypothetical protein